MYTAWLCDSSNYPKGECFYDNSLSSPEFSLIDPVLKLSAGAAGSFTFKMAPNHPFYDSFEQLKSTIFIYRDDKIIWEGRVISEDMDFWKQKSFTCEGALAYLNDSIQPFQTYQMNHLQSFEALLNMHNAQVANSRAFQVGALTVQMNGFEYPFVTNYEGTLEILNGWAETYGGFFHITWDENHQKILNYIDLETSTQMAKQTIEFGKNLLDYTHSYELTDLCTVVVPLGKTLDRDPNDDSSPDRKLDICEVNDGLPYLVNSEAVATYGWIARVVEFNDVEDATALKNMGAEYLRELQFDNMSIEISAFDMGLLNPGVDPIP